MAAAGSILRGFHRKCLPRIELRPSHSHSCDLQAISTRSYSLARAAAQNAGLARPVATYRAAGARARGRAAKCASSDGYPFVARRKPHAARRRPALVPIARRAGARVSPFRPPSLVSHSWRAALPPLANEVLGVQHAKACVFDDTVVLTGANLSCRVLRARQTGCGPAGGAPALADVARRPWPVPRTAQVEPTARPRRKSTRLALNGSLRGVAPFCRRRRRGAGFLAERGNGVRATPLRRRGWRRAPMPSRRLLAQPAVPSARRRRRRRSPTRPSGSSPQQAAARALIARPQPAGRASRRAAPRRAHAAALGRSRPWPRRERLRGRGGERVLVQVCGRSGSCGPPPRPGAALRVRRYQRPGGRTTPRGSGSARRRCSAWSARPTLASARCAATSSSRSRSSPPTPAARRAAGRARRAARSRRRRRRGRCDGAHTLARGARGGGGVSHILLVTSRAD